MSSGRYQPLSPSDTQQIHQTALRLLAEVGLADATPSGIEYMLAAGCTLSEAGRLLFPRALVEDTIARAARNFILPGQDPRHDLEPWGKRAYFGTAGAAESCDDRPSDPSATMGNEWRITRCLRVRMLHDARPGVMPVAPRAPRLCPITCDRPGRACPAGATNR